MSVLPPLIVAVPFAGAALGVATDHWLPAWVKQFPALLISLATAVLAVINLVHSDSASSVYWFGGWHPHHGVAIGISFVSEPLGAGLAALVSILVFASLLFSWHYLEEAPRLYRVLMLVFLGGMCGFALSGDLFNMFVFFEVMGVAAYALAGYTIDQLGPLQGALNFAITNTLGAYMVLFGTALVYGETGALNLAQIGKSLDAHPPNGLLTIAFTLVIVGFLVKAAIVPFHLWLADAHAVAPAPVCVLFSGVMVELGLLGVARVYWTVFDAPFGVHAPGVRNVLLGFAVFTALVGAVMCFLQRHLKRLLAYSTISHAGVMLAAVALLDPTSLAGGANLVIAHGFLKGGLFLAVGILLREEQSVDELRLHGKARRLPLVGMSIMLAAVGLIGLPFVGTFLGHALIDDGAIEHGHSWLPVLLMIASGISAAAILRAGARVFIGLGPTDDPLLSDEPEEESPAERASLRLMVGVTAALVAVGLSFSLIPGLQDHSKRAAVRFVDRRAYVERVLRGGGEPIADHVPAVLHAPTLDSTLYGIGAGLLAVGGALFGLYRRRVPAVVRRTTSSVLEPPLDILRAAHSGVIGDYVAWLLVGTVLLGGLWTVLLR